MIIKQINTNNNLLEFQNSTYMTFIIDKYSNIGIGTTNPNYKLDILGSLNASIININGTNIINTITSNDIYQSNNLYLNISNLNYKSSNVINTYSSNFSNSLFLNKQDKLTASSILLGDGSSITNINYNNLNNKPDLSSYLTTTNLTSTSNQLFSNFSNQDYYSSNSNINFTNYQISLINPKLSQWTNNQNKLYIINSNIGIGTTNPNYNLDVNSNINTNELFLKGNNISNIFITSNVFTTQSNNLFVNFSNQDYNSSNANINYTNWKVSGIVAGQNPWSTNGNNLYYNNGNIGIGSDNPNYKLVVGGDLNINGNLRISNAIVPFTPILNTNITTSNGSFNYINNSSTYGYITFLNSGSITFPQTTSCDILMVGAGGNGGFGSGSGGGGANSATINGGTGGFGSYGSGGGGGGASYQATGGRGGRGGDGLVLITCW